MRHCLFCSDSAETIEDAWPRWMTDQFRTKQPSQLRSSRLGGSETTWRVLQPELKVRCVCRLCNNGWMSRLEMQVQPFMQPMLRGLASHLDSQAQSLIALWAVKTAMVLEALGAEEQRVYTPLERERLRLVSAVPWRTSIWLATSSDPALFLSAKTRHMPEDGANAPLGMSTTIGLSNIVLQVFTIRVPPDVTEHTIVNANVRRGPWHRATIQIWPTQSRALSWPTQVGLNGEQGLNVFAERFGTTGLSDSDITVMAV